MNGLVLSVFPGIDLLGRGFELEGFCVVRGPDVIWGGDVRDFHPPAGVFDGVIGGPPCQAFWGGMANLSRMVEMQGKRHSFGNLIPEFERVVSEAEPDWWVMENVAGAPAPSILNYPTYRFVLNNRWLGEPQNRRRAFSSNLWNLKDNLDVALFESPEWGPAVLASAGAPKRRDGRRIGYSLKDAMVAQGLSPDFLDHAPFTNTAKRRLIGNGVPIPMARAVAKAVRKAMEDRA